MYHPFILRGSHSSSLQPFILRRPHSFIHPHTLRGSQYISSSLYPERVPFIMYSSLHQEGAPNISSIHPYILRVSTSSSLHSHIRRGPQYIILHPYSFTPTLWECPLGSHSSSLQPLYRKRVPVYHLLHPERGPFIILSSLHPYILRGSLYIIPSSLYHDRAPIIIISSLHLERPSHPYILTGPHTSFLHPYTPRRLLSSTFQPHIPRVSNHLFIPISWEGPIHHPRIPTSWEGPVYHPYILRMPQYIPPWLWGTHS